MIGEGTVHVENKGCFQALPPDAYGTSSE